MLCLFLFGKRVNGALSWFPVGGFNLQPSEFVKITVALAVSKYISDFQTDLKKTNDQLKLFLIIFIPIIIIVFQNDTGSSIVFFSLFFVLYREGISQNYVKAIFSIIILAILSLKLSAPVTASVAISSILIYFLFKRKVRNKFIKIQFCKILSRKNHVVFNAIVFICVNLERGVSSKLQKDFTYKFRCCENFVPFQNSR